jgi:hypothetical protein
MSLPPEADPSAFLERAPALASLLPDEALAQALARGDASALYRALLVRLAVEPAGPARDTLAELVADRTLFAMAESPPTVRSVLGTGTALSGAPREDAPEAPYIATRVFRLLGVPLWPLGQHLVRRGRDGAPQVLGGVPRSLGFHALRGGAVAAFAAVGLGVPALLATTVLTREVNVVNGLSRPVRVCVDGRCQVLGPLQSTRDTFVSLPGTRHVEASWPGEAVPFETVALPTHARAVYNVLGAAPAFAMPAPGASSSEPPRPLVGIDSLRDSEALEVRAGGWRETFQAHADAGQWLPAATLAQAVALADATALPARELAARAWLRLKDPAQAARFGERLVARYPEDISAHRLHQDLLIASGRLREARTRYAELAASQPQSVEFALLKARLEEPGAQQDRVKEVMLRFYSAPAANRALARLYFLAERSGEALQLLDEVRGGAPESLEDLELRVRCLLALHRVGDASNEVRRYGQEVKHHGWDFAVLAGRLARVAGPDRTQYITRDFLPPEPRAEEESLPVGNYTLRGFEPEEGATRRTRPLPPASLVDSLTGRERSLLFELTAGDGTVKEKELRALTPGPTRDALVLARAIVTDLEEALALAVKAPDSVLSRLEPDAAAVVALELSRLKRTQEAERVFGSSLPLLLARETLERYVREGPGDGGRDALRQVSPGLRVAAHLVRARHHPEPDPSLEYLPARDADALPGFARRALDTWQDPVKERVPPTQAGWFNHTHHHEIIQIIREEPPRKKGTRRPAVQGVP